MSSCHLKYKSKHLWCRIFNKCHPFFAFGFPEVTSHRKVTARDIDRPSSHASYGENPLFPGFENDDFVCFRARVSIGEFEILPRVSPNNLLENGTIFPAGSESRRAACILYVKNLCYHNSSAFIKICMRCALREINHTVHIYNNQSEFDIKMLQCILLDAR